MPIFCGLNTKERPANVNIGELWIHALPDHRGSPFAMMWRASVAHRDALG